MAKTDGKINSRLYYFLATLSGEENYPPFDNRYLSFSYGKSWGIKEVRGIWEKTIRLIKRRRELIITLVCTYIGHFALPIVHSVFAM